MGIKVDTNDNLSVTNWRLWMNGPSRLPGGAPVENWRDNTMKAALAFAIAAAPVNNPLNARHRAGWVGEYKASMFTQRTGNSRGRGFILGNRAAHAVFVDFGRSASRKDQKFSWSKYGGEVRKYKATQKRDGYRILGDAVDRAIGSTT